MLNSAERFPFGVDWQLALFKLLLTQDAFANAASKYLRPEHFEPDVLQWGYDLMLRHRADYGAFPSLLVLVERARRLDPSLRDLYLHALEQVRNLAVPDEAWVREGTIDFVRRNIFVRAMKETRDLFNAGRVNEAYDHIQAQLDSVQRTNWESTDEGWFFEELSKRQGDRWRLQREGDVIGTGIPELDLVLDGGIHLGELNIWMAYPKIGKTTMLAFHGFIATRGHFKNVLHFVLEGQRSTVENRYDTMFTHALYSVVKRGDMTAREYAMAFEEYRYLKRKLLIRGFTEHWEYTVPDLHAVIKEKRRIEAWVPDLVIVDYADLLAGRKRNYSSEFASQADAYRDLKTLASRDNGYRVWTAAQARRPEGRNWATMPHLLNSKDISGLFDKVRVCDFLGSLNATHEEQSKNELRLYAELYRDNPAQKIITIEADFSKMHIGKVIASATPVAENGQTKHVLEKPIRSSDPTINQRVLGYNGYTQTRADI